MKMISKLKWLPTFALILGVMAVSCSDDDENDPIWKITMDVTSLVLNMNDGDVVSETITPSTTRNCASFTEGYKFTSSDPLVASVSNEGVITAMAGGSASIVVEGLTSGVKADLPVEVVGVDPNQAFTKMANLDGTIEYAWNPGKTTVTSVAVFDESGEFELIQGDADSDPTAIDYILQSDYVKGTFVLSPVGSDNFKPGQTVLVKVGVEGVDKPILINPTIHQSMTSSATISAVTFKWDAASVISGIAPKGVKVYLRNNPANAGESYTKGNPVDYAVVSDVIGGTMITVSGLISTVSYWFEVVNAEGAVLAEVNSTIPSPMGQVKAAQVESIWYGDASSAGNQLAECRRIADRITIGQGLTYDQIAKVEVKDAAGAVIGELGEWRQDLAVYEYSYLNKEAPHVVASFEAAVALKAAYIHDKVAEGRNGEFKHISFFDLPYSDKAYNIVITAKNGAIYTATYNTKKKHAIRNRAKVRAMYNDASEINAENIKVLYYSNVPGDNMTFKMSDPAVATISSDGVINFIANGICTITISSALGAGTYSDKVVAAKTYCKNYDQFQTLRIGEGKEMDISTLKGNQFASATSSSNNGVVTFNKKILTAVAEGTTVVTIADNQGNESKMTVTVVSTR